MVKPRDTGVEVIEYVTEAEQLDFALQWTDAVARTTPTLAIVDENKGRTWP